MSVCSHGARDGIMQGHAQNGPGKKQHTAADLVNEWQDDTSGYEEDNILDDGRRE